MVKIRENSHLMIMRYGALFYVHTLVGVADHTAPSAIKIRLGVQLSTSMCSLISVDASGNRLSDVYTPNTTEFNATNAWKQNFSNGNQNNNNKNNNNYVRAVRK